MDLVDRYFMAIRRGLPAAKADDLVAELRDDFCSRQEDREAKLGRTLSSDEQRDLIRAFGHPAVVAGRYRKHQWLIGPDVFPFYLGTMRIVMLVIAAVAIVAFGASVAIEQQSLPKALAQAVGNLASAALTVGAIVTLIFAILERTTFPKKHVDAWQPSHLPDLGEERPGPWKSAIEVTLTIVLLLWWIGLFALPVSPGGAGFRLEPGPIWHQLYVPILLLIVGRLTHNLVQWLRPRWKSLRIVLGAATAVGAIILLAIIYRSGELVTVVSTGVAQAQRASLQDSLDLALRLALFVIGVIWGLNFLTELWRLARRAREKFATVA